MNARTRFLVARLFALLPLLVIGGPPDVAEARITKIQITTMESPTFGGYAWPGVGQYEKIVGKAFGEVDPYDPKNAVIVDIQLAPRNPGGNDPGSVTDPTVLANAFLMPRGYTMVWSGWDKAAGTSNAGFNTTITLPIAKNPDGSTITGPAYEYIVTSGTAAFALNYPAATRDQSRATLTHRVHLDDMPAEIPATGWTYNASGTTINLVPAGWVANDIYEFSYTAKDPSVNGLGFAAVRDWNAWLRYEAADDSGTPNPLKGDIQRTYTEVVSQPGRLLNDFRHLGFNQAENGRKVFDGHMNLDRGWRRHQHELPVLAARPHRAQPPGSSLRRGCLSVRQREDARSDHGQDG